MNLEMLCTRLAHNAEAIGSLVQGVGGEQARWKPASEDWSILEVINHLYDEEIEDFRAHLDHILHRSGQAWLRIDPAGWVASRRYNEREWSQSLANFLAARRESLDWLRRLDTPDWEARAEAPFGSIRAGDMVAAWVAHDILHQRQLVELQWAYMTRQVVTPYQVRYAGDW